MRNIVLTICLSLIYSFIISQTKDDVIRDIKKQYYTIENNLTQYNIVQLNDTISYLTLDQRPVKVTIQRNNLTEYYYYDSLNIYPYFIYSTSNIVDDKFYFRISKSGPILYEWLSKGGKTEDYDSKEFQDKNTHYLKHGRNIFTLVQNSKVDTSLVNKTIALRKTLSPYINLNDLVPTINPHVEEAIEDIDNDDFDDFKGEENLGESRDTTFFVENNTLEVTESYIWHNGNGGGLNEAISFRNVNSKELISIEHNCRGILDQKNGYDINLCSYNIYHNNAKGKCVVVTQESLENIQFDAQISVLDCH